MNRTNRMELFQDEETVTLQLPHYDGKKERPSGEVWFFYPSDLRNDRRIPLSVDEEGLQKIDKSIMAKGECTVKVSWKSGAKRFYSASFLTVN